MEALGPIELRFDKRKALAAASVLLEKSRGRMPYMKLIKLLYAADRESLLRLGKPIVGGHYYAMKLGPVVSEVLDLVKHSPGPEGPAGEYWSQHFERIGYDSKVQSGVRSRREPGSPGRRRRRTCRPRPGSGS